MPVKILTILDTTDPLFVLFTSMNGNRSEKIEIEEYAVFITVQSIRNTHGALAAFR